MDKAKRNIRVRINPDPSSPYNPSRCVISESDPFFADPTT
jgi:hypothetical protein